MLSLLGKHGVASRDLVAKVVGGACMFGDKEIGQIGDANVTTVLQSLNNAGVRIAGQDVGGGIGRRIILNCDTGGLTIQIIGRPSFVL